MAKVTLKTIGDRLNLSTMTVSKALRGGMDISEETRQRVLNEAKELKYVPNMLARNLLRQRTKIIGFLFPEIRFYVAHSVVSGAAEILEPQDFMSIIGLSTWSHAQERKELDMMLGQQVEGVICTPLAGNEAAYKKFLDYGGRLVFVGNCLDLPGTSWVALDGESAARQVGEHLLSLGHRRIGMVVPDTVEQAPALRPRFNVFRQLLAEQGIPLHDDLIGWHQTGSTDAITSAVDRLLEVNPRPTAIFCISDAIAYYVMHRLGQRGIRIPDDIAVAGVDGSEFSKLDMISLTTVAYDMNQLGRTAARCLLEQIEHDDTSSQREMLKGTLRVGRSTMKDAPAT